MLARRDTLFLILLAVIGLVITVAIGKASFDDAYITFRYARNIALGNGFVYNPGERYLGTTTPLFTLLLSGLGWLAGINRIPDIAQCLSGLALVITAMTVYLTAWREKQRVAGVITALLLLLNPFYLHVWGGEAFCMLALIMLAFFFYQGGHTLLPALFGGLAFLTRGEGIIPIVVIYSHYVMQRRRLPWGAMLAFIATVAPLLLYFHLTFGMFLPGTLAAKTAQMQSGAFGPFFRTMADWIRSYLMFSPAFSSSPRHALYWLWIAAALLGWTALLWRPRTTWWLLVIWIASYTAGYAFLNVPFYTWYAVPCLFGGFLLAGLGCQFAADWIRKCSGAHWWCPPRLGFSSALALITAAFLPMTVSLCHFVRAPVNPIQRLYVKTGRWLNGNTAADASIGFFEIGFMGYHTERRMIDPMGLVQNDAIQHVKQGDFKWAYRHYRPDLIVISPTRWHDRIGNITNEPWFQTSYRKIAAIDEPGYRDAPLAIFKKQ